MSSPAIGQIVPDLSLPDKDGQLVRLSELYATGPVVVFFYPKDETPGCTAEACAFRDAHQDFVDAGATVVGISSDSEESHRAFASNHRLPYTLLADKGGAARKAWNVPKTLGIIDGRVTYVIDKGGVLLHMFSSQIRATKHVGEALDAIRKASSRG
jgi:peroxiredoxin Q/BCP